MLTSGWRSTFLPMFVGVVSKAMYLAFCPEIIGTLCTSGKLA